MASRQPVSPHRHGRPCAAAILLCPNSPAACAAPRCSTPPAMMPAPRPLDALMTSTSSVSSPRFDERDGVGVVVQDHRHARKALQLIEVRPQSDAVPAAQDRRVAAAAAHAVHRAGQAQTDAVHRDAGVLLSSTSSPLTTSGIRSSGPSATSWSMSAIDSTLTREVAHRQPGPADADRHRQHHDARVGVEGQQGRPAGRRSTAPVRVRRTRPSAVRAAIRERRRRSGTAR